MSMLQKKGTYLANLGPTSLEEKEDTKTVAFNALCKCTHIRNGNAWEAIDGDQNIFARLNLVKKDGSLNEINITSLKISLGWDGTTFGALQQEEGWGETQVQVVVDEEEYQGKPSLKVQYINPKDYTGTGAGIKAMDKQLIQSLDAKYGAMLRAINGNGSKPANGNGGRVTSPAPSESTGKQLAWAALVHKCDEYTRENPDDAYDQDRKIKAFKSIVASTVPGKTGDQITPANWAQIKHAIDKDFSPTIGELLPI
jgi:hypothetical protein